MYKLIVFGIPSLLAIFIFEFLNAQIFFYTETNVPYFFEILRFVYLIPGIAFAYVSDKNYRKEALLLSHVLGLASCAVLFFYGFNFWALLLFAIVFNPVSVARAAILDNFPHSSPLKLMAVTFMVQGLSWLVFSGLYYYNPPLNYFFKLTVFLLFVNVLLIFFLFKDNKDIFSRSHAVKITNYLQGMDHKLLYILAAFILADTTCYLVWGRIVLVEQSISPWITLTNTSLILGSASAMLYKRLPHLSIITLTYVVGFCMVLICILEHSFGIFSYKRNFLNVMSHYFILAGLYLPLVTDSVITMLGTNRKALGAVIIDLSQFIALVLSAALGLFISSSFYKIAFSVLGLFLVASILQKHIERRSEKVMK